MIEEIAIHRLKEVELSALRFSYKKGRDVLAIDSLTIARGETVFLHGPSGSGKTTLLGLLAGVLQATMRRIGRTIAWSRIAGNLREIIGSGRGRLKMEAGP